MRPGPRAALPKMCQACLHGDGIDDDDECDGADIDQEVVSTSDPRTRHLFVTPEDKWGSQTNYLLRSV